MPTGGEGQEPTMSSAQAASRERGREERREAKTTHVAAQGQPSRHGDHDTSYVGLGVQSKQSDSMGVH